MLHASSFLVTSESRRQSEPLVNFDAQQRKSIKERAIASHRRIHGRTPHSAASANAARPNLFGTHSILSVAQPRIAHARISHVMHGCSVIRDQNGISVNEENTARSYKSNLVMTNETEPRTRRFYVDLSPEQEKVLLKKAHHFSCKKRGLPDSKSELTIELFQQLVDLLATAWKE